LPADFLVQMVYFSNRPRHRKIEPSNQHLEDTSGAGLSDHCRAGKEKALHRVKLPGCQQHRILFPSRGLTSVEIGKEERGIAEAVARQDTVPGIDRIGASSTELVITGPSEPVLVDDLTSAPLINLATYLVVTPVE
jgi:hypothetical protein